MHILHIPLRLGWNPVNVRALLSNVIKTRPDGKGGEAACETWDNAILACETDQGFPMILETKRISPGDMNTWYLRVLGTKMSAEFSTKDPKSLKTMPFSAGSAQAWRQEDVPYESAYPTITGGIFEFGFSDAILQMWAAFLVELSQGDGMNGAFRCATPQEALGSHHLFTAALESQKHGTTAHMGGLSNG
jgi:predicted dehydrogenase